MNLIMITIDYFLFISLQSLPKSRVSGSGSRKKNFYFTQLLHFRTELYSGGKNILVFITSEAICWVTCVEDGSLTSPTDVGSGLKLHPFGEYTGDHTHLFLHKCPLLLLLGRLLFIVC